VACGQYWINVSVYDSIGQTSFDDGNNSFEILCPDSAPTIEVWEPGGSPGQTYTKGDVISVKWNAADDNPLPPAPINITFGSGAPWTPISTGESNDGTFSWDTKDVDCPGIYWMNLSVYDSVGQTTYDESNYSFTIFCPGDSPPIVIAFEPGGSQGQTFVQGELVNVTWSATDDKPLPLNPIDIMFGNPSIGLLVVTLDEANDGIHPWDTSNVPCPGTYRMNVSVRDSIGQKAFDEANFSFEVVCSGSSPPVIEDVISSPNPQTVGRLVTISANVSDIDTDIANLTVTVAIASPEGVLLGNYTMSCTQTGQCTYESDFFMLGVHTFVIWAVDPEGNWAGANGTFAIAPSGDEPGILGYNWKPVIALMFAIVLLILGFFVSHRRPLRFKGDLRKDRLLTFLLLVLPFIIAEIATGLISLFTGLLSVPPILGLGMLVDMFILILGLIVCILIYMKGQREPTPEKEGGPAQSEPPEKSLEDGQDSSLPMAEGKPEEGVSVTAPEGPAEEPAEQPEEPPAGESKGAIAGIPTEAPAGAPSGAPAVESKVCESCGKNIQTDFKVCPYCGVLQ
jgi:hypothetical protein